MNVHLYPSVLKNESRILKIVHSLRSHDLFREISVIGRSGESLPPHEDLGNGVHLYRLAPLFGEGLNNTFGKIFRTLGWYLAVLLWMRSRSVECLNCHSLPVLPLSVLLKTWKQCKLVYDTHELETETHVSRGVRKSLAKIVEGVFIRQVDAVCVVNRSIAMWYQETYALSRVWVVHNMPPRIKSQPKRTGLLRNAIGLRSPTTLLFIYQGLLSTGRGIEMLLDVFAGISGNTHLVCMGYGPLEETVRNAEKLYDNIHFMPAVAPDLVQKYTVDADVGIALSENTCLSYYLSAPNKLFEYAACGVAALVSDVPEMSRFVDAYEWGWKVNLEVRDFRCLVESIDAESLKIKRFNATRAGAEYCWENEEPELLMMYEYLDFNQLNTSPT